MQPLPSPFLSAIIRWAPIQRFFKFGLTTLVVSSTSFFTKLRSESGISILDVVVRWRGNAYPL